MADIMHQKIKLGASKLAAHFRMIIGVAVAKIKGIRISWPALSPETPPSVVFSKEAEMVCLWPALTY